MKEEKKDGLQAGEQINENYWNINNGTFSNKSYGFQINSNLFEKILFENFQDPEINRAYLFNLFQSNQVENLCDYLNQLEGNQKNFDNLIEFI